MEKGCIFVPAMKLTLKPYHYDNSIKKSATTTSNS